MYSTIEDLQKRLEPDTLIALSDDDGDGTADTDVVEAAIADADAAIDGFLRSRYALPLPTVPAILTSLSCALAVHALFLRRRETMSDDHKQRYESALGLLQSISRGEIGIGSAPDVYKNALPQTTTDPETRIFDRDSMKGF